MRTTIRRLAFAALATAAVAALVPVVPASAAPEQFATIRAAHFSPDTPGVDIYLTAFSGGTTRLWVPNAEYGGVSQYERVASGLYVVAMRPHGAPATDKPAISWNLDVRAGQVYTTAAIGSNKALKTIVLHDDLTAPAEGTARIRLIQAASRAPRANVAVTNGAKIASAQAFASTTGYTSVAAGTLSLQASAVSLPAMTAQAQLPVQAGTVNSLLLLDAPGGGITLRSVLDAAGAPVAPVGAVPAGGGGSLHARFVLPSWTWLWAIVCCSLLGGGLGVANARRGRT
jgi:hypothetical protein